VEGKEGVMTGQSLSCESEVSFLIITTHDCRGLAYLSDGSEVLHTWNQ